MQVADTHMNFGQMILQINRFNSNTGCGDNNPRKVLWTNLDSSWVAVAGGVAGGNSSSCPLVKYGHQPDVKNQYWICAYSQSAPTSIRHSGSREKYLSSMTVYRKVTSVGEVIKVTLVTTCHERISLCCLQTLA